MFLRHDISATFELTNPTACPYNNHTRFAGDVKESLRIKPDRIAARRAGEKDGKQENIFLESPILPWDSKSHPFFIPERGSDFSFVGFLVSLIQ